MRNFPKQRLPYSDKVKDDYKWARNVINNLLLNYGLDTTIVNQYHTEYQRKLANYQLFNNQLNQKDFEQECNPLGLELGQFQDKIQPYNKTYNKIQVLLGDELRRPFNYRPILINSDGIRSKLAVKDVMLRKYVLSQLQPIIQQIQPMFAPDELQGEMDKILPPEEIDKYMKYNYREAREILATKILDYLKKSLSIADIKNDAFKHGLISGEELAYVGIRQDNPFLEVLNPLGCFYHKSPETK